MTHQVFICHATEDKDDLVRPLAEALVQFGLDVWYDELSLKPGDSLRQSIDRGLRDSRFGVVVLSPHFFKKHWTEWELSGLIQRNLEAKRKIIIPVWHNISSRDVVSFSPSLANIIAIKSSIGAELVAEQIIAIVSPNQSPSFPILETLPSERLSAATTRLNDLLGVLPQYNVL